MTRRRAALLVVAAVLVALLNGVGALLALSLIHI